jgi:hypothetical protein
VRNETFRRGRVHIILSSSRIIYMASSSLAQRLKKGRHRDTNIFRQPAWILNFINSIHSISCIIMNSKCTRIICPTTVFDVGLFSTFTIRT